MAGTIDAAIAELSAQYRLQLASYLPLAEKRAMVAELINSSLPSSVQDEISDNSIIEVFADLTRAGLVELEVEWTTPETPPQPPPSTGFERPPLIDPFNPDWTPPPLPPVFDPYLNGPRPPLPAPFDPYLNSTPPPLPPIPPVTTAPPAPAPPEPAHD